MGSLREYAVLGKEVRTTEPRTNRQAKQYKREVLQLIVATIDYTEDEIDAMVYGAEYVSPYSCDCDCCN